MEAAKRGGGTERDGGRLGEMRGRREEEAKEDKLSKWRKKSRLEKLR